MLERHRSGINPNTLGKSEQNRKEAMASSHLCTVSLLHTPAAEDGTFHWLIQFISPRPPALTEYLSAIQRSKNSEGIQAHSRNILSALQICGIIFIPSNTHISSSSLNVSRQEQPSEPKTQKTMIHIFEFLTQLYSFASEGVPSVDLLKDRNERRRKTSSSEKEADKVTGTSIEDGIVGTGVIVCSPLLGLIVDETLSNHRC
ncbi:hypothetical protein BLNAU_9922 [Blattamonas nauphoetae]|uniref:Uncharacterized protein n=1 Tax=Blattamonas nauphoetae TaxID=2049346 RepID=A0ABQ9XUN3_9EUKA|nr:hypothetical protein BLNAU_9922 [Blattamonas nauphoetae]